MKNPCGKMRSRNDPYEVWRAGDWAWYVLKKYASPEKEAVNLYARWFCVVVTPYTTPIGERGDCYVADVCRFAKRIK